MGHGLLLVLVVASSAAPKVAVPALRATGVEPGKAEFVTSYFASQLQANGLEVVTAQELASLLGLERQRALLGCSDAAASASCMAELANALGSDAVLVGDFAFFGGAFVVNLKLVGSGDAKTLVARSFEAADERELLGRLRDVASTMATELSPALGRAPPEPRRGASKLVWVPVALGAVAAIAGGALLGVAGSKYSLLKNGTNVSNSDALSAVSSGPTYQWAGVALVGVAVVALVAAGAWWLLGRGDE